MPRYFFNVRVGDVFYEDPDGQVLDEPADMLVAAVADAKALLRDGPHRPPAEEQSLIVTDETGRTVHVVNLSDLSK